MIDKGFTYYVPPFMIRGNVVDGVMSFADREGWINDIGNHQHELTDLGGELFYLRIQAAHRLRHIRDALFCLLRLFPLPLCHKRTDLLAERVTLAAQIFAAGACSKMCIRDSATLDLFIVFTS